VRSFYDASIEPFINRDRSDSKTGQSSLVTRFCVVLHGEIRCMAPASHPQPLRDSL
jgi:hypothetical protein